MQPASVKQEDGGEGRRPARKRKVQWADEDDDEKPLTTVAPPDLEQGPDDDDLRSSRVDEHGMLVSTHSEAKGETGESHPTDGTAEASKGPQKQYLAAEIYNPIEYGDFRSYMKHKRAKLKVQEASLLQEEEALLRVQDTHSNIKNPDGLAVEIEESGGKRSDALKGCCIYINGQTHPPYSELRRLLVLHGGDLMAYLDQKTPVTHIVASNLTPKKRIEFKDYKVVLPGWILESIELGRKADWRKWRCDAITGSNGHTSISMVGKPGESASDNAQGLGDWRNLDRSAKLPRQLPRIGDEDESPWGKPTNQTNLLDRFTRKDKVPIERSNATGPPPSEASKSVPRPFLEPTQAEPAKKPASSKGVRFGEEHVIKPLSPIPMSEPSTPPVWEKQRSSEPEKTAAGTNPPDAAASSATEEAPALDETTVTPTKPKDKIDYSIGTDPASKKAANAISRGHYASRPSNTHAARLLASPSWRERNTATSEGFLAGYFAKSRLHHLSTWKTSLQDMVSSALREAGRPLGSSDLPKGVQRVIMHIDFDSFFVAVGLRKRPDLQDKPVVVCHGTGFGLPAAKEGDEKRPADNQSSSTSEIASCSYKAREFGVRNGMSLGQAKRLCPQVETIPYDFEAYDSISLTFYTFLLEHSDALQAVSVDEALVDVSLLLQSMRDGDTTAGSLYEKYRDHLGSQGQVWTAEKQLAEAFRDEIRERCGCEASIGIGSNILVARLATRKAKPGGSFHLTDDVKQPFLDELDVDDLHGIGWSLRDRMRELFETVNIGEILAKTSERKLVAEFGPKKGKMIWDKMHGVDADRLEGNKLRQSVGSHVNYGIRFLTEQEAENFVAGMCQEVAQRARAVKLRGRQVSVQVMVRAKEAPFEAPKFLGHGVCDTHHRSVQVSGPGGVAIDDEVRIRAAAWPLIRDLRADPKELRGIAISLNKLEPAEGNALSPAKPKGGQSVLQFGSATRPAKTPSMPVAPTYPADGGKEDETSDVEQADEPGVHLPASFEKGPEAATPRRPGAYDRLGATVAPSTVTNGFSKLPPATQLMLPSKSQIDPDVFDALPTQYRRQIEAKFGSTFDLDPTDHPDLGRNAADRTPMATPLPSQGQSGSQSRPRVLPRSTPTTPQKAKAAPSAAMAEALMLPSASQIDPAVLAELPDSVRKEIERQVGFISHEASSGPSSVESTPTSAARKKNATTSTLASFLRHDTKLSDRRNALFRSVSESPTKKRVVHRLLQQAGNYVAPDQPIVDRDAVLAMDPSKISDDALIALDIDAEVFRALPVELQREMFRHHSEQKKSEKARFKAGKSNTFEELTLAEQRRRATLRAAQNEIAAQRQVEERMRALHGGPAVKKGSVLVGEGAGLDEEEARRNPPLYLVARPRWRTPRSESRLFGTADHAKEVADTPSIRGLSSYADVEKLIRQWVTAFAKKGPRAGDVDRIGAYLADVIRAAPGRRVEDVQNATSLMGHIESCLDDVQGGGTIAEEEWGAAKDKIERAIQAQARKTFLGAEVAR
ncbi:DNA-repair protein, UmuC-like protein [Kalmanozyma brasiliensis GHG001]|uniref:DNA repair protein REV1 n=1 Tax=Kalmanozyma brasiliensis (strain GHG001) TaxID=1365824 RepID=V5EPF6_KALBG|nr:DNA-repair protein, UmuC-like protein [Kalmanozyma brasiliensis GHG001]EST04823.1 DNA-repair protein, UmuC-like protein [Kalmanozyma brasiliensis GHG001]